MLRKAAALCNLGGQKIKDRVCSNRRVGFSEESFNHREVEGSVSIWVLVEEYKSSTTGSSCEVTLADS